MPEGDDRSGGVFPDHSGWRVGFALAWCGLLALTAAAFLLLGGFSTARGVFLAGVAAGEFVLAVVSSVLLERIVFHHVERLRTNLESNVQYLRTMAEVSTVIAGTLDPEELYRILPERVWA
jgi:hypothetical protein